jgi:hypothetical protein
MTETPEAAGEARAANDPPPASVPALAATEPVIKEDRASSSPVPHQTAGHGESANQDAGKEPLNKGGSTGEKPRDPRPPRSPGPATFYKIDALKKPAEQRAQAKEAPGQSKDEPRKGGSGRQKSGESDFSGKPLEPSRPTQQERLDYRLFRPSPGRFRRGKTNERLDQFDFLRKRLEEVIARYEDDEVVLLAVRNEKGLPHEFLAPAIPGRVFVRDSAASLPLVSFVDLYDYFAAAAGDGGPATFIDWIRYSQKSGDIERLIVDVADEGLDTFEARLKERGFRFFVVIAVDDPKSTTSVLKSQRTINYLPWTDLWLAAFADDQDISVDELHPTIGQKLQRAAEWRGHENDEYERSLYLELRELENSWFGGALEPAVVAIEAALSAAKTRSAGNSALVADRRADLRKYLAPLDKDVSPDPIKQVMLTVAVFAGGTSVGEFYGLCRRLLPGGPAEVERLPPAVREKIFRDAESSDRMNREREPFPGWEVVFDNECDVTRAELKIHVRDGQAVEVDSQWKVIDLKREIAQTYPALINALMQRIRDKRLFMILSDAESALLVDVITAMRNACGKGFDDRALAIALMGAVHDLQTPLECVERLYPGYDPKVILELAQTIDVHQLYATLLAETGQRDPDMERKVATFKHLLSLPSELNLDNIEVKISKMRAQLLEESIRRLTSHIVRMHTSSSVSQEQGSTIVPRMIEELEGLLSTETYVAFLAYIIATASELDIADVGRRLLSQFSRAGGPEAGSMVLEIHRWLVRALKSPKAPHLNWLRAFDPLREGKGHGDRIRAFATLVWDTAINYDVVWNSHPYERMQHIRIAGNLFGALVSAAGPGAGGDEPSLVAEPDGMSVSRLVNGFLVRDPASWLHAIGTLEAVLGDVGGFNLVEYIRARLTDIAWILMSGAAEGEKDAIYDESDSIMGDLLVSLTSSLHLGFERDFELAAWNIVVAKEAPGDRLAARWMSLYALFWPAMIAHWRFVAFGLKSFEKDSEAYRRFRKLLDELVAAVPRRAGAFHAGFEALAGAAEKCAKRAKSMRLGASTDLYQLKADRLRGLADFFAHHMRELPVVA